MIALKNNTARLPVPPPKHPEASATNLPFSSALLNADDSESIPDGIPDVLKVANREPLTPEQEAKLAETQAKTGTGTGTLKVGGKEVDRPKGFDPTDKGTAEVIAAAKGKKPARSPKKAAAKRPEKAAGAKKEPKAGKVAAGDTKRTSEPRKGSKTELVGKMLLRKSGCTAEEVKTACDWPSVSMPAQAKAAGLKLTKTKDDGKPTRYFGEPL